MWLYSCNVGKGMNVRTLMGRIYFPRTATFFFSFLGCWLRIMDWLRKLLRRKRVVKEVYGIPPTIPTLPPYPTPPFYPPPTVPEEVYANMRYADVYVYTQDGHYYAVDNKGSMICQDSPTACIQEAINYVLSLPTGGKVYIRAGDYYLAPFPGNPANAVITATIPYNAALIVEGDGDATKIHLPQNNSGNNAWLFYWVWNGTAAYTMKSRLRNIAFINDVNTSNQTMDVLHTVSSTNNSAGLEVDGVSMYNIKGTGFKSPFNIYNLYDVTFSRIRYFDVNPASAYANLSDVIYIDGVSIGKVVDSFFYSEGNTGAYVIYNNLGVVSVDNVEIYGGWYVAFAFGNTDASSQISVTNSIIGANRSGAQGIQGQNIATGPNYLLGTWSNGVINFTITSSQIFSTVVYLANGTSSTANIIVENNIINTNCPKASFPFFSPVSPIGVSGGDYANVQMHVRHNIINVSSPCSQALIFLEHVNSGYFVFKDNAVNDGGTGQSFIDVTGISPSLNVDIENNTIFISGMHGTLSARNQFIWFGSSSSGGLLKLINNTFTWTATPSSSTTFYLAYNTDNLPFDSYYLPTIIMKGNTFNFPTSNAKWGSFVATAGALVNNPNALFVDLDNTFNLSGINLPYPSVSTPSVPPSGTAQQNTYLYPVEVYISGGSATAVQVARGGVTYTVWSSSTATAIPPLLVRLEPGDSITITYSTAPSWTWVPAKYIR